MGFVYHAHYVDFFEAARTEALREIGLSYRSIEESGIIMPVIDLAIQYRRPAHYDDLLLIRCLIDELPTTRFRLDYEVFRCGDPKVLAQGYTTLCFVDAARDRPVRVPAALIAALRAAIRGSGDAIPTHLGVAT